MWIKSTPERALILQPINQTFPHRGNTSSIITLMSFKAKKGLNAAWKIISDPWIFVLPNRGLGVLWETLSAGNSSWQRWNRLDLSDVWSSKGRNTLALLHDHGAHQEHSIKQDFGFPDGDGWNIGKEFLPGRVMILWHREAVAAPGSQFFPPSPHPNTPHCSPLLPELGHWTGPFPAAAAGAAAMQPCLQDREHNSITSSAAAPGSHSKRSSSLNSCLSGKTGINPALPLPQPEYKSLHWKITSVKSFIRRKRRYLVSSSLTLICLRQAQIRGCMSYTTSSCSAAVFLQDPGSPGLTPHCTAPV